MDVRINRLKHSPVTGQGEMKVKIIRFTKMIAKKGLKVQALICLHFLNFLHKFRENLREKKVRLKFLRTKESVKPICGKMMVKNGKR